MSGIITDRVYIPRTVACSRRVSWQRDPFQFWGTILRNIFAESWNGCERIQCGPRYVWARVWQRGQCRGCWREGFLTNWFENNIKNLVGEAYVFIVQWYAHEGLVGCGYCLPSKAVWLFDLSLWQGNFFRSFKPTKVKWLWLRARGVGLQNRQPHKNLNTRA